MRTEKEIKDRIKRWEYFIELWNPYDDTSDEFEKACEIVEELTGLSREDALIDDHFHNEQAVCVLIRELRWVLKEEKD